MIQVVDCFEIKLHMDSVFCFRSFAGKSFVGIGSDLNFLNSILIIAIATIINATNSTFITK